MLNLSSKEIEKKITIIQESWGEGIVNIGKAYIEKKDYVYLTNKFIDDLYLFKNGKLLFKPTKASNRQFRKTKAEFISYFIGHNKVTDEDIGFALEPWKGIKYNNFDFMDFKNIVISMGNYIFTDYQEKETIVEYSFGYMLDKDKDRFKIVFHHSSIPYNNE